MQKLFYALMAMAVAVPGAGFSQFVDDEFNSGTQGPQWTFTDGTPAGGSVSFTGTHLRMEAQEGTDHWFHVDDHVFLQQNAPTGTNWEVVTKIDNYDPTEVGFQARWQKSGLQLWQDNDHWIALSALSNFEGTAVTIQANWQADAVPPGDLFTDGVTDDFGPLPLAPGATIYLKIIKSSDGYMGQYSPDGVNWQNVLTLVRNLDSADGYFQNEKIRLFQSGAVNNAGTIKPVDFDYIRANPIAPPSAGYSDDEFSGTSLGSNWKFYEGFTSGTISVSGGVVSMVPGYRQDVWVYPDRAMRIYQDAPTSTKYVLTTKVGPTNLIPFEQWQGYGIMLRQDQSNWVMIMNQRSETGTNRVEVAFKRAGLFDAGNSDFGSGVLPEYLRITQDDKTYTVEYSFDNSTWTQATNGQFTYPARLRDAQVHLIAKRVFGPGQAEFASAATGTFDYIRATYPPTAADDWQLLY